MFVVIFWRFSKIGPKARQTFVNFSQWFLDIIFSKGYWRLLKITEEDLKMFWSYTNKFKCS